MDLLVVGGGAMGRWFGRTVSGARVTVTDSDPAVARETADALDGRTLAHANADGEGEGDHGDGYDVVCVAVPIPAVDTAVGDHADRLRPDGALVDVTGAMAPAVAAGRVHAPDHQRSSLHPLFAPERAPGRVAAVPDAPGERTATVRRALERAGNDVFETTAAVHDRAMETVQAQAHAATLAFALAADPVPEEFSTPVFGALAETAATMTGGDPRVYADVQDAFGGADDVASAARRIADADRETFERLYREAGRSLSQTGAADPTREER
jgi:prephenate dehydrogenase